MHKKPAYRVPPKAKKYKPKLPSAERIALAHKSLEDYDNKVGRWTNKKDHGNTKTEKTS